MAYEGSAFSGFARQNGPLTVQGSLNDALEVLYKRPVETTCAGRTDAGVHALRQVVSFDLDGEEFASRSLEALKRSLNALIDDHAVVCGIKEKPFGFSARFDAVSREYRYFISAESARPVLIGNRVWHVGRPLDIFAMQEGAAFLVGEHDFKSFCQAESAKEKPTCRGITEISVGMAEVLGQEVVCIKVVGTSFLHSMVRIIVGTLVAVGLGKHAPAWVEEVLLARERCFAGETAPASGLILWQVCY
ncbi:MAG: tRNA pseudouridine(38-40) synthase TruA [Eggerthellaceae bacterium]|nr:tRNA pseudouridine(38-40) synthase TruA [Eggerthellaceae bacterium]